MLPDIPREVKPDPSFGRKGAHGVFVAVIDAEPLGDVDRHHQKDDGRKNLGDAHHEGIRAVVQRASQHMDHDYGNPIQDKANTAVKDGRMDNGPICLLLVFLAPDAGLLQQDRALGDLNVYVGCEFLDEFIHSLSGKWGQQ